MYMGMHSGVFSLVHAIMLLAVSFFILLAARKSDSQNIKTFGYVIAVLLWVAAALIMGKGIFDRRPMFNRMQMMGEKMERPVPHSEVSQQAVQAVPSK
jgi:low temperature requirement protein LtrA